MLGENDDGRGFESRRLHQLERNIWQIQNQLKKELGKIKKDMS